MVTVRIILVNADDVLIREFESMTEAREFVESWRHHFRSLGYFCGHEYPSWVLCAYDGMGRVVGQIAIDFAAPDDAPGEETDT